MSVWRYPGVIIITLFFISGCYSSSNTVNQNNYTGKCADWARIPLSSGGDYFVENNVWNKKAASSSSYRQCIDVRNDGGERVISWEWQWPESYMVVSYPEIIYGFKPWGGVSASKDFPVRAQNFDAVVDYAIKYQATGVYNIAFSMWTSNNNPPSEKGIQHEIMIWVANGGMSPAGSKVAGKVTLSGTDFEVWIRNNHGDSSGGSSHNWKYIAFNAKKEKLSGPLVLRDFTQYLIDEGHIPASVYIDNVELGTEIIKGQGRFEVRNFAISIKQE